ncbi:unnamed protein product, partial [Owenia fusiformis]
RQNDSEHEVKHSRSVIGSKQLPTEKEKSEENTKDEDVEYSENESGSESGQNHYDDYYEVEKILRGRFKKGELEPQYLIKWKGYKIPTWEPESNMTPQLREEIRQKPVKMTGKRENILHTNEV